jgi:hypothetical protein
MLPDFEFGFLLESAQQDRRMLGHALFLHQRQRLRRDRLVGAPGAQAVAILASCEQDHRKQRCAGEKSVWWSRREIREVFGYALKSMCPPLFGYAFANCPENPAILRVCNRYPCRHLTVKG